MNECLELWESPLVKKKQSVNPWITANTGITMPDKHVPFINLWTGWPLLHMGVMTVCIAVKEK